MRAASKAYITCRQELSVLLTTGSHPNIVPLVGICMRPLSLILHYAPMGSLESILKEYKRTNTQLALNIYQKLINQVCLSMFSLRIKKLHLLRLQVRLVIYIFIILFILT